MQHPILRVSAENCVPSLKAALEQGALDPRSVQIALSVQNPGDAKPAFEVKDRHVIRLTDGTTACEWKVETLTSLFRGDKQAADLGSGPPTGYEEELAFLEIHAVQLFRLIGDRRDEEMLEVYSALRRRPDGRSLGTPHDYMWQVVALLLGSRILSKSEFEVIVGRLERSCRTFRMGPTSRNYAATLHRTIG